MTYHFRSATYTITVENPTGAESGGVTVWLDGALQGGNNIPLADDSSAHEVRVVVGQP
jgi:cellobiose phosphorylase